VACRAFERLDVEADGVGGNARQHSSRSARGAEWSPVHDASPLFQAGALQNSQSPVDTKGDGDGGSMEPFRVPALVKIAHFREVEHSFNVAVLRSQVGKIIPSIALALRLRNSRPASKGADDARKTQRLPERRLCPAYG
jgi:hypothetical protein